jgi:hypothetical protein
VLLFHVRDFSQQLVERRDRIGLRGGQRLARMEVRQQHDQRIADAAELLSVGGDVGQDFLFDPWARSIDPY